MPALLPPNILSARFAGKFRNFFSDPGPVVQPLEEACHLSLVEEECCRKLADIQLTGQFPVFFDIRLI